LIIVLLLGLVLELNLISKPGEARSASTVASNGLQLSVAINATQITMGHTLQINVSLFNTLAKTNSVPTSNDWLFEGVPVALIPLCGHDTTPVQVVVLKGSHNLQDLPRIANATSGGVCLTWIDLDHLIFQPSSSEANVTGMYMSVRNDTHGPYHLSLDFTTSGYWDLHNISKEPNPPVIGAQQFTIPPNTLAFVPGAYTIAVADEWGQAAILHFEVKA
jgi:hypothetical protein